MAIEPVTGRLLDLEYEITTWDARLADHLRFVMRDSAASVTAPTRLALRRASGAAEELLLDDHVIERGRPEWALAMLHWHLNRCAVASVGDAPALHAGAVGGDRGVILLVGASGTGKSTSTLALAAGGLGYLTDDVAVVEADGRHLRGSAKPIGLRSGAWEVLGISPDTADTTPPRYRSPFSRQAAASALGARVVDQLDLPSVLVFLDHAGTDGGRSSAVSRAEALTMLISACFNPERSGIDLLHRCAPLVQQAECIRWPLGPIDQLRAEIERLLPGS